MSKAKEMMGLLEGVASEKEKKEYLKRGSVIVREVVKEVKESLKAIAKKHKVEFHYPSKPSPQLGSSSHMLDVRAGFDIDFLVPIDTIEPDFFKKG